MTDNAFRSLIWITRILLGIVAVGLAGVILVSRANLVPRLAEIFITEENQPTTFVVDATHLTGTIHPVWAGFAQGGEEPRQNMLAGTEPIIKTLRPRYIRLDHIFDSDYYEVVGPDGNSLNWSKLDQTVASIKAMGATPFFSLSYMPSGFAASKTDVPYDWSKWQWLVEQLILHYSGYHNHNLSDVYYEVWNEPDLESFGGWKYYGDKNYLTLYESAARGALTVRNSGKANTFKIGGPATTALYENWVTALVKHTKEKGLPLDFISWHNYSFNPNSYATNITDIWRWLGSGHEYELVISEWGPDPEKNDFYASNTAAAFSVAATRRMLEGLHLGLAFEIKDGPGQGNSGWGLLTHQSEGIRKKPRWSAFVMMSPVTGDRLALTGEGSHISGWAVRGNEEVDVILANYHPSNPTAREITVEVVNLEPGGYLVSWMLLSGGKALEQATVDTTSSYRKQFSLAGADILRLTLTKVEAVSNPQPVDEETLESQFGVLIQSSE